ncbi:uncharacterized protein LOC134344823 [Mobula hypostoma]|uniref:uncharacterized protein LOC134344823 n=1 Tax=Mobula hypostoma TaxID=723540 RepID=UPI002FC34B58
MTTVPVQGEKRCDQNDHTVKVVRGKDEITGEYDPNILLAEMACKHAVDPNSLTAWCRYLLHQGQYKFYCPALKDDGQACGQEWPYHEVRKLAVLTREEQLHFEETVAVLAAAEYCEYKSCPGCGTYVECTDLSNLSVRCTICTAEKGSVYKFCWQCLKPCKGRSPRSDRCDNEGCTNLELDTLRLCPLVNHLDTVVKNCPSIRACLTCGSVQILVPSVES